MSRLTQPVDTYLKKGSSGMIMRLVERIVVRCMILVGIGTVHLSCSRPVVRDGTLKQTVQQGAQRMQTADQFPQDSHVQQRHTLASVGISPTAMDATVSPCDDFYQYSCGGWLKRTDIPAEESRWSRSFSEIKKRLELQLKEILDGLGESESLQPPGVASAASVSDDTKLATFYGACVDTLALDKSDPLGSLLKDGIVGEIDNMKNKSDLGAIVGKMHRVGISALFSVAPEQDFKDATKMIAELDQSGLGLPDREYYLSKDKKKVRNNLLRTLYSFQIIFK